jgi:hypothetical protein
MQAAKSLQEEKLKRVGAQRQRSRNRAARPVAAERLDAGQSNVSSGKDLKAVWSEATKIKK